MTPVLDLTQLSAQTAGNAALQREVLTLFVEAMPGQAAVLRGTDADQRRAVAHQIVGSARAIGAGEVARLAAAVEGGAGNVDALLAAMDTVRAAIARHLARPD